MDGVLPRDIVLIVYKYMFDYNLSMLNKEYSEVVSISYWNNQMFATSICGYWVVDRCCKYGTWVSKLSGNCVETIRHHRLYNEYGQVYNKCRVTEFCIPKNY